MLGLFMNLSYHIICLFVCLTDFESCLVALERIAEWKMDAIHLLNLSVHVGEKGKRLLPQTGTVMTAAPSPAPSHGKKTAMLEGPEAPGAEIVHRVVEGAFEKH